MHRVIVSISEYRGRDTIDVCSEIIEGVKKGSYKGMIFILDTDQGNTMVGATGSYRKDPGVGTEAAFEMANILSEQIPRRIRR